MISQRYTKNKKFYQLKVNVIILNACQLSYTFCISEQALSKCNKNLWTT